MEALTNCRVIAYDFKQHDTTYIILSSIDDVVVMNQRRNSDSTYYGTYSRAGTRMGMGSGTSRTIGDVVFMKDGKPFFTFRQISDPHGLSRLVKSVKKELFTPPKKLSTKSELDKSSQSVIKSNSKDDPLKVLKLRLAKGEITKEDYEELKKTMDIE